jgi:peroxiredoxin
MCKYFFLLVVCAAVAIGAPVHPTLALGSPAPDFSLPGVDGATHKLADYSANKVLVVVFTCNHCPIAQMYEERINQLYADYQGKSVAVVAIQGNDPKAIRVDELDSSDISDTLAEMKIRAQFNHLNYPYLYDGETQAVTEAYGPKATPHVFVFDRERRLRYEGRFDNSYRKELVKTTEVRDAIEALLADKPVAVAHTGVFGCSTKWREKHASQVEEAAKIEGERVSVEPATAEVLKTLRSNATSKLLLVNFWATWCGPCVHEFPELETTYRMYRGRDFDFVAVSANMPDEQKGVTAFLQKQHASNRNLLFASDDTEAMQKAFDTQWESGVPYTVLIAPGGKILATYQGDLNILELRRTILANLPSDYAGFNRYWIELSKGVQQ